MVNGATARHWQQWVTLVLGIWLLLSPWILGFATTAYDAAVNSWAIGMIVAIFSLIALYSVRGVAQEWVNLIAGAWLIVSPWLIGYPTFAKALGDAVIGGILVVIFAIWAIADNTRSLAA